MTDKDKKEAVEKTIEITKKLNDMTSLMISYGDYMGSYTEGEFIKHLIFDKDFKEVFSKYNNSLDLLIKILKGDE